MAHPFADISLIVRDAVLMLGIASSFSRAKAPKVLTQGQQRIYTEELLKVLENPEICTLVGSVERNGGTESYYKIREALILQCLDLYTRDLIDTGWNRLARANVLDRWDAVRVNLLDALAHYWRFGSFDLNFFFEKVRKAETGYGWYGPGMLGEFFLQLTKNPTWQPLLKTLSFDQCSRVWSWFRGLAECLPLSVDLSENEKFFLECDHLSQSAVKSWFYLHRKIFTSGLAAFNADELLEASSSDGQMLLGLQLLSQNQTKPAAKAVIKALKLENDECSERRLLFSDPLKSILFLTVLFADRKTPTSANKLGVLMRKADDLYHPTVKYFLIFLYEALWEKNISEDEWLFLKACRLGRCKGPLTVMAYAVLYKIFRLQTFREELEDAIKKCPEPLPPFVKQQELSALEPDSPELSELVEKLGMPPLLSEYRFAPEWEKSLDKLMALTETFPQLTKKQESGPQSRIVYFVNRDSLDLTLYRQKSKDGVKWSKGTQITLASFAKGVEGMDEIDRKVSEHVYKVSSEYFLQCAEPLRLLMNSGRVFVEGEPPVPLEISKDRLRISVGRDPKGGFIIKTNQDDFLIAALSTNTFGNFDGDHHFTLYKNSDNERDVLRLLRPIRRLPKEAESYLTKVLSRISIKIPVSSELLKQASDLRTVEGSSKITFRISPNSSGTRFQIRTGVRLVSDSEVLLRPGTGESIIASSVQGRAVRIQRNLAAESENWTRFAQKLSELRVIPVGDCLWELDTEGCLLLMEFLRAYADICEIEWPEGVKFSVNQAPIDFSNLKLAARQAERWFTLDGSVSIDGKTQLTINQILDRLKDRVGHFIRLDDIQYIAVTQKLLQHLEKLETLATCRRNKLLLSQYAVSAIEDFQESGALLKADAPYIRLKERIAQAEDAEFQVPKTLCAELRPYQKEGFEWISRLCAWGAGGILADDMGLGKTVQAIALMLARQNLGPSLLVMPTAVLYNWKSELARFAPTLRIADLNGGDREKIFNHFSDYDVILCTYGVMNIEIEILQEFTWNLVVLDEAHAIKNKETQTSAAVMRLISDGRLLLTGTPIQNNLSEIWNLMEFANPGYLGSFEQFGRRFIAPIEKNQDKEKQALLKQMISPFILRRTKSEVLAELPPKTELTVPVELSQEELAIYENIRTEALRGLKTEQLSSIQALAMLTKLRRAACSPALVDERLEIPSSKIRVFIDLVSGLVQNRHRALVFSQFTSFLALVRNALDKAGIQYLYLDGSTLAAARKKLTEQFRDGDMPLFLISLKAGGTGLNLTAADYVIHLDPWWNPAVENQASDRAYRIGQEKPVTIYRLISEHTVETKILELQRSKKNLADALLEGGDVAKKLTREEILELLKLSS